jgi:hypothetical protein
LIVFSLIFQGFAIQPAPAAQAVNVQYIHDCIYKKHGITVPIKTTTPLQIANVKYLLCAVDRGNEILNGTATNYCNHALATQQVVDTVATIDAVNRLIKYCVPGTYFSSDSGTCIDCGLGYYCTGGGARTVCTYGAIGCPGQNHASNPSMPAGVFDNVLTLAQVTEYMPPTDISQWRRVTVDYISGSLCGLRKSPSGDWCNNYLTEVNLPENGCAGTIGPGTYLFVLRWMETQNPGWYDDLGRQYYAWDYRMIVLTKPTGYKIFRTCNTQDIYLDTNNAAFTSYTIRATHYYNCYSQTCTAPANVAGLTSVADLAISIYELK